jgi:hypothetical protein
MLPVSDAAAQPTMKSVAGTYTVVSNPVFGDNPRGQMILTPDGRYNLVITRQKMAPIASNSRTKATDAEYKAIVDGSIAHYGKYSVDDGGKALTFHVEVSTFPNWDGKPQKRMLTVKGDTLTYVVATPSTGGAPSEVSWKRVKK